MSVSITSKDGSYTVTTTKPDGSVAKADTFMADKAMAIADVGKGLSKEFNDKTVGYRRTLILTTLATVFGSPALDGFMGQGDRATGKLPEHFKAGVRDAEKVIAIQLVEQGHLKLPVHKFDVPGKLPEQAIQSWLSVLRDDPGYSKAKSVVSRYFCLVGSRNITEGGYLIPVPVMEAHIKDVVKRQDVDDSYAGRLTALIAAMQADKKITSAQVAPMVSSARLLLATVEGLMRQFSEVANAARGTSGELGIGAQEIVQGAADAIAQAKERSEEEREAEILRMQGTTSLQSPPVDPEKMRVLADAINNNKPTKVK